MYILTTLEFPTHNFNFHLLTTSVNAKYYYSFIIWTNTYLVICIRFAWIRDLL